MERQWEEALTAEATLQSDYERFLTQQPAMLSAEERAAIRRLASDIPALWHASPTTVADRQDIIRQLIERVIVTVQGDSEQVQVQIHWLGGHGTQSTLIRPVARVDQLSYYPQLMARVTALRAEGYQSTEIARLLNAEGWHPPKRCETFNGPMVQNLLVRLGLRSQHRESAVEISREADEWTLAELSHQLDMPQPTLYKWLCCGVLTARQVTRRSHPLWLIRANADELERLRSKRVSTNNGQWPAATE